MTEPKWRVGIFAQRFPGLAAEIGRAHALNAIANGLLYENAGVTTERAIRDEQCESYPTGPYGGDAADLCCGNAGCASPGSACQLGVCAGCGDVDEEFEGAYPEAEAVSDEAHAFEAALRDINADLDLEDRAGAVAQAIELFHAEELAYHYVPRPPAAERPDGGEAPRQCPICGAVECPACGCTCECVDSAADIAKEAAEGGSEETAP